MENKFLHLENLISIENQLINKIKFILHFCSDDNFKVNHHINDFIEFYRVHFEFDNYKYIHDALKELKLYLYGANEISPFLIQRLIKEVLPINTNLDYYSDRIKKDFEIDIDDMFIHINDRSQNNLVFRFYLKVSDFGHSVELDKLIGFCKDYVIDHLELKKSSVDEIIETNTEPNINIDKLSNEIDELIKMMHPTGWEKVFWSEQDFESYKEVLVGFFTNNEYSIPNLKIKIKPNSKTNIIGIFKKLHDKHSKFAGHMKDDTKLFAIVRILDQWSGQNNAVICKRISSDALK